MPAGAPAPAVQAEFLERFTRFVDWPEGALDGPDAPFPICLLGSTQMEPYLERMARTRKIKDRRITVRQLERPEDVEGCAVVWISSDAQDELARILAVTGGRAILTVGETQGLAEKGVHIALHQRGTQMAFDINVAEARRSGLRFSSRLLRLGNLVGGEPPP